MAVISQPLLSLETPRIPSRDSAPRSKDPAAETGVEGAFLEATWDIRPNTCPNLFPLRARQQWRATCVPVSGARAPSAGRAGTAPREGAGETHLSSSQALMLAPRCGSFTASDSRKAF